MMKVEKLCGFLFHCLTKSEDKQNEMRSVENALTESSTANSKGQRVYFGSFYFDKH